MKNKWLILSLIIFIYLPISIDASILLIAVPALSTTLKTTGNQLLWIMDIYSLVMAGLLLPMGALGDKIGFKKLAIVGLTIFGIASLSAAFSPNASFLIASRVLLAIGASMVLPATISGIRKTFLIEKQRNMALGLWITIGIGGASIGPLIGGYMLEYFYWGSVFIINIPIVIIGIIGIFIIFPNQVKNKDKEWKIGKALILISAILLLVFTLKSSFRVGVDILSTTVAGLIGFSMLYFFVKNELSSKSPMIDFHLLSQRVVIISIIMAMTAMITVVGFEFLVAQEMQFVHGKTALEAGFFMIPLMISSGLSGIFAGWLSSKFELRVIATFGMGLSALCFFGFALSDFGAQKYLIWLFMILLGVGSGVALLSSTAAIMSCSTPEKSASAGALEGMAYELGAGFGIVFLGGMLSAIFTRNILLPAALPDKLSIIASSSIGEAFTVADSLTDPMLKEQLLNSVKISFSTSHEYVQVISGVMLVILTFVVWKFLPKNLKVN